MVVAVRRRPTRRQLEVLRAYIASGSITGAAHDLEHRRVDCAPAPVGVVSADGLPQRSAGGVPIGCGRTGAVMPAMSFGVVTVGQELPPRTR